MSGTISTRLEDCLWWSWYWYATGLLTGGAARHDPITFLNYGYVDLDGNVPIPLDSSDEPNRLCIQLYDQVVRPLNMRDSDVLEISCGHGGGAYFLKRYSGPRALTGLDLNPRAIRFCRRHYGVDGLSFVRGNAEVLPFDTQSFDVVINVEASHRYRNVDRFLTEVSRVLRPGGHLAIADVRLRDEQDHFRQQLFRSGLDLVIEERITENVTEAMRQQSERRSELINSRVPRMLRKIFRSIVGVEGSEIYRRLLHDEAAYLRFIVKKPLAAGYCGK